MQDEVKIADSLSRKIFYAMIITLLLNAFLMVGILVFLLINKNYELFYVFIPFTFIQIIFYVAYFLIKISSKTFYIFTANTIRKFKREKEIFIINAEDIKEIWYYRNNPLLILLGINPLEELVICLKEEKKRLRIFTKIENAKKIQKIFNKEIVFKKT